MFGLYGLGVESICAVPFFFPWLNSVSKFSLIIIFLGIFACINWGILRLALTALGFCKDSIFSKNLSLYAVLS